VARPSSSENLDKDEIRTLIDEACEALGVSRLDLAEKYLGCSNSTLHSWITKEKIPTKYKDALEGFKEGKPIPLKHLAVPQKETTPEPTPPAKLDLSKADLEDLVNEIKRRGGSVTFS
jgi:hypothetical protein